MRILLTTDTIGGVWTYTMDLIKGLEKYNVEVILATMGDPISPGQMAQVRKLKRVILDASNYKLEWMKDPWKDLERAHRWLLQLTFTFNPDVIHLNSYAFDARLFNAPVLVAGHSCVLSWWQAVKKEPAPREWQRYADLVKRGLQSAHMVVAPSHTMMSYLEDYYGNFTNSQVIYNSVDESYFKPGKKEKIVFCMGRMWDEAKNLRMVEEVAREIGYPVFIAGDHDTSGTKGKIPNLHFLGKLDKKEIAQWLSISAVYASPAYYEPFGLSVLEAAHSGCALLLGKIDSLQEIWKDNALYCRPESSEELKSAINEVMTNEVLFKTLSESALKRAADFRLSDMAAAYYSLYNSLLGAPWLMPDRDEISPSVMKSLF